MSCTLSQRVQAVAQCGTYRIMLFSGVTTASQVIIENIARERSLFKEYTPVLTTMDGLSISYIEFLYSDFGEFLNSASDFEIRVQRAGEPVLIYLGLDEDSEEVLMESLTVQFEELYNADNEKAQITTQTFKI